jgi:hypothetical protein
MLGISRPEAQAVLERILDRLIPVAPDRASKLKLKTQKEFEVISFAASFLKGGSQFSDNSLFEDLCRALQRRRVLSNIEKQGFRKVKAAVTIFALTSMHNRKIDLGDGNTAKIAIMRDIKGNLGSFAIAEVT